MWKMVGSAHACMHAPMRQCARSIVLVSQYLEVEGKIVAAAVFRRLSDSVVPGGRCGTDKLGAGGDIENNFN